MDHLVQANLIVKIIRSVFCRVEDCLTLMHDSLRRLFRALYILPRRPISEEFLSAVDQVRHRLRKNLQDYEPFLAVKAQRNLAITR